MPCSVGLVFDRDRKFVLLLKHGAHNLWELPRANVPADTSFETALQERMELETGLKIRVKRQVAEYCQEKSENDIHLFECVIEGGELNISSKVADIAFFGINSLPHPRDPLIKQMLEDTYKFYPKLIRRGTFERENNSLLQNLQKLTQNTLAELFHRASIKID